MPIRPLKKCFEINEIQCNVMIFVLTAIEFNGHVQYCLT